MLTLHLEGFQYRSTLYFHASRSCLPGRRAGTGAACPAASRSPLPRSAPGPGAAAALNPPGLSPALPLVQGTRSRLSCFSGSVSSLRCSGAGEGGACPCPQRLGWARPWLNPALPGLLADGKAELRLAAKVFYLVLYI